MKTNSEELRFALTYNTTCFIKMLPPNPTQRPFDAFVVAGKECYSWQEAVRAANNVARNMCVPYGEEHVQICNEALATLLDLVFWRTPTLFCYEAHDGKTTLMPTAQADTANRRVVYAPLACEIPMPEGYYVVRNGNAWSVCNTDTNTPIESFTSELEARASVFVAMNFAMTYVMSGCADEASPLEQHFIEKAQSRMEIVEDYLSQSQGEEEVQHA